MEPALELALLNCECVRAHEREIKQERESDRERRESATEGEKYKKEKELLSIHYFTRERE